jgi:hypothetical protein|tara:strand:- start:637 stop:759 length:123 start_codon:yes stop_codon:yes gene_type:complete
LRGDGILLVRNERGAVRWEIFPGRYCERFGQLLQHLHLQP